MIFYKETIVDLIGERRVPRDAMFYQSEKIFMLIPQNMLLFIYTFLFKITQKKIE